jgi:hypothetical protein
VLGVILAAIAVTVGAGAAIAASQGSSPSPTAFFDSVAKHLGISSEKLRDATKAAAVDQVDAALAEGRITKAQADELKSRIESGELPPFFGPFLRDFHDHMHGPGRHLSAAADYLGLTVAQLRDRLADGRSLADVAKARGRSVEGLKQTIIDDAKRQLDEDVGAGRLTRDEADAILERLQSRIDELVQLSFRDRWHRGSFRGAPRAEVPF